MRIVVAGGTGVIGRAAVRALLGADHDVVVLSRSPENDRVIEHLGAQAVAADLFDPPTLVEAFAGADAVVNLATHVPSGYSAALPGAWRENDRLHLVGVHHLVDAARAAGVRRVVQESASFVYADQGDSWITEHSPLDITPATEPVAVAESRVQGYECDSRVGVILRFGTILGGDLRTLGWLRAAGLSGGTEDGWAHVVHPDDLGSAVVAALIAPSGTYNVGAAPVRRSDLARAYAEAADEGLRGRISRRMSPTPRRMEPLQRSRRVCGDHFCAQTGWTPLRPEFGADWLTATPEPEPLAAR